jgi:DNA polymerase-3 subunit delta'
MWLHPEKNYTIDQLDDLFSTLSLQLQPNEHFFFILQKADFLTAACANKLLKPMEEPPAGYHFILLAEHAEQILPTIKSRCTIHTLSSETIQQTSHPLVEVFTKKMLPSNEFSKILDTTAINERETMELLDDIISYWLREYQQQKREHVSSLITKLQKTSLQPPMPGSSVAFWRNLYLQVYNDLL